MRSADNQAAAGRPSMSADVYDTGAGERPSAGWQRGRGAISPASMNAPSPAFQRDAARPAPELSVVVPTFKERDNVPLLVGKLARTLTGVDWEIIFVDDNSPDGTAA